MAEEKTEGKKRFTVIMPNDLMEKLEEEMEQKNIESYAHMIRIIVKEHYKRKEKVHASKED